ncbi:MAG: hypothetical protein M1819_000874 [Sarea resinae]|nr:MAG: hypothetical protein M1819_000874 [Sarea resinae]
MSGPAIRFVLPKSSGKGAKAAIRSVGSIYLSCRVKPHGKEDGITSVAEDQIRLSVAARPKDDESNMAVVGLVSKVLGVPKSDVQIPKGSRRRTNKTVVIENIDTGPDEELYIESLRKRLEDAVIK